MNRDRFETFRIATYLKIGRFDEAQQVAADLLTRLCPAEGKRAAVIRENIAAAHLVGVAVLRYALHIVRTSRPKSPQAPDIVTKFVAFGGSVRAAQYLVLGAKARALTNGRYHVSYEDIRALAHPVLRHRVLTNFRAESEGVTSDAIIDELLTAVPVPKSGM